MNRFVSQMAGWLIALTILAIRLTCRSRIDNDPRPELYREGLRHVFAVLHAHQVAGLMAAERGSAVIVSRSNDGEVVVPLLRMDGHQPIRGSSGTRKGGGAALKALTDHVRQGRPAIITVDGPRGPRGHVHKGAGLLSKRTGARVICAVATPTRRWIFSRTWDRLQIPKPFSKVTIWMSDPLVFGADETLDEFACRIQNQLLEMEQAHDPKEAARFKSPRRETSRETSRERGVKEAA